MHLLISLLIFCLIAGVVLFVARSLLAAFSVQQPFANIAYALVMLILLVLFLNEVGWAGAPHAWRNW